MSSEEADILVEFYFMRHAESLANKSRVASGSGSDSPLTPNGVRRNGEAADFLEDLEPGISEVHHTDMYRSFQGAEAIGKRLNVPLVKSEAFNEQMLGEWEGLPWEEAAEHFLSGEDPPKGENYAAFHHRIMAGLKDLAANKRPDGKKPLVVSHGGVWLALNEISGNRTDDWPDNCDIFKVTLTGDWQKPTMKAEHVFKLPPEENDLTFDIQTNSP